MDPVAPAEIDPHSLLAEAGWVERLARRLVRDDATAQDLVQETWLAALEAPPAADGRLRPWLARVLLNFARQRKRGEDRRLRREATAARPEALPPVSEASERIEAQRVLAEALAELPEDLKTTVVLRYFDGLSPAEIARRQGIPGGTVRWRLHRATDELRERLAKRGGEGRWALALLPLLRRPPLGEIAAQAAAGSAAGIAEGVLMMNTITKVGVAAVLVVTASVGAWMGTDRSAESLENVAATRPLSFAPAEPDPAPAKEKVDHELAPAPTQAPRESVAGSSEEPSAPAPLRAAGVEARFLDRYGQPVEGASLVLQCTSPMPSADSGADGRVRMEVLEVSEALTSSDFTVARAAYATHFGRLPLKGGETTYLGDIRLEPGGSVAGRVFGLDGRPAQGAKISVTSPQMVRGLEEARLLGPWAESKTPSATALADGTFLVAGVRAGVARVWAGSEDTRWSFTEPVVVPENGLRDGIELRLEPFGDRDLIRGIVLSPEGDLVPDAVVRYVGRSEGSTWSGNFRTGKDGSFRHKVQVQGAHDFQAHDQDGRWPDAAVADVQPGTLDLVLRFPTPRWIEVAVKVRGGGAIPGYAASILSADRKRTLAEGEFGSHEGGKVALLVPGEPFVVSVRARGHGSAELGPWTHDEAPPAAECTLDRLPGVRGRVVQAEGQPVSGARVALHEIAGPTMKIERNGFPTRLHPEPEDQTTTDDQGFFELDPSRPGGSDKNRFFQRKAEDPGEFTIVCDAHGWARAEIPGFEIDPAIGVDGIEIALVKGGAIEGRVLTAPGKDAAGVIVGLDRSDASPRTQRVGPDGRYRFEHLTPGRYRISREDEEWDGHGVSTSWSSGDEERAEFPTNCSVDDGRTTRFDLDLRDDGPCVLAARVSVNGMPGTGWTAALWLQGRSTGLKVPGGAVDAFGRLRLEVTEPGPYRFVLEPPIEGSRGTTFEAEVELRRGEVNLPIDLKLGAVRGHCAAAPAEASISFDPDAPGPVVCHATARPDSTGNFELPYVPAGPGRVVRNSVHASGMVVGPVAEAKIDVPVGGSTEVEVP